MNDALSDELAALGRVLTDRVIGQAEAVDHVIRALARYRAGFGERTRPAAAFLMLGPTGVGKTMLVEALADVLHGSEKAVLKVHCAELRSDHELARLKGAPPGYVGWKECVPLFTESRLKDVRLKSDLALMLFDEVEKAHPALWDFLLGLLDKGEVILNDNSRTDFTRTMVFFTGNVGAREIASHLSGGLGFATPSTRGDVASYASRAAGKMFSPEFRNRLTATITFAPLDEAAVRRITEIELRKLARRIAAEQIDFKWTRGVGDQIATDGYDPQYGARHVKRAIERLVEDPLARMKEAGRIKPTDVVSVSVESGRLVFRRFSA